MAGKSYKLEEYPQAKPKSYRLDEYPSVKAPATTEEKLQAFSRGVGQGGTSSFGDELSGLMGAGRELAARYPVLGTLATSAAGLINPALAVPGAFANLGALSELAAGEGEQQAGKDLPEALAGAYREARDSDRKSNAEAEKASPGAYLAGNLVGSIAAPNPVKGGSIPNLIKGGALQGVVAGAGLANEVEDIPKDALVGAGLGGAGAAVLGGAAKALPTAAGLAKSAKRLAVGALGGTKGQAERMLKAGQLDDLGEWLLKNEVTTLGANAESMAPKVGALVEKGGAKYDAALAALDEAGAATQRKEIAEGAGQIAKKYADRANPGAGTAENAIAGWQERLLKKPAAAQAEIEAAQEAHRAAKEAAEEAYQEAIETETKAHAKATERYEKAYAKFAKEYDAAQGNGNKLRISSNFSKNGPKDPGPLDLSSIKKPEVPPLDLSKFAQPEEVGTLKLSQLEAEKSALNRDWLSALKANDPADKAEALATLRTRLKNEAEALAYATQNKQGPGSTIADEFMAAKKELGSALSANELLSQKVARNVVNRDISLTDTGAGLAAGNALLARGEAPIESSLKGYLAALAHKQVRERGAATAARLAWGASRAIEALPAGARNALNANTIPAISRFATSVANQQDTANYGKEQYRVEMVNQTLGSAGARKMTRAVAANPGLQEATAKHLAPLLDSEAPGASPPSRQVTEKDLGDQELAAEGLSAAGGLGAVIGKSAPSPSVAPKSHLDAEIKRTVGVLQLGAALEKQHADIDRNIGKILRGEKAPASPTKAVQGTQDFGGKRQRKDAKAAHDQHVNDLSSLATDPNVLLDRVASNLGDMSHVAPGIYGALVRHADRATKYLVEQSKRPPKAGPLAAEWHTNETERHLFAQKLEVVQDPMSVMRHAAAGTLTRAQMDALKATSPLLARQISDAALMRLADSPKGIPYRARMALSLLTGVDVDGTMGAAIAHNQAAIQGARGKAGDTQGAPSTPGSDSKITLAERTALPSQRRSMEA